MRLRTPAIAAVAASLVAVPAASAHVTVSPADAAAGSYATLDFQVPHGCGESPTTSLTIQIPEGVYSATPQVNPGWRITRTMAPVEPPVDDGHGGQITERVATITWTGGPLPHDEMTVFGLSTKMPETGETAAFPAVQRCAVGVTRWIEPVVEGEEEPEHPAPTVTLTPASGDGATTEPAALETGSSSASESDDDKVNLALGLGIGGLVLGAAGLGMGLMARRRPQG